MLGQRALQDRWNWFHVGTTEEISQLLQDGISVGIPVTEPVLYTVNGRTGSGQMPAYLAGLLLGDGSLPNLRITACEHEIRAYLLSLGFHPSLALHTDGHPKEWTAAGPSRRMIDQWLRNHGLRKARSWEKFIPNYVFTADLQYRLEFVQGLMDTDGYVDDRGRCYFTSTSFALARGMRDLIWSLGGVTYWRERDTGYCYEGEYRQGRRAYELYIRLARSCMLFRLQRKQQRCTETQDDNNFLLRTVDRIEPAGEKSCQCIAVNNPYGLYVTDDYLVTHNTAGLIGKVLQHARRYGARGRMILFRRTFDELSEVQEQAEQFFTPLGATYLTSKRVWSFPGGAQLRMRYLERDSHADHYAGHSYSLILIDEAGNFPHASPIDKISCGLRSAQGVPVQMILTGNPGGVGHNFLKRRYIDPAPPNTPFVNDRNGNLTVFIPSRLQDNILGQQNDPHYAERLRGVGADWLVKAWLSGDWDIVAGGLLDDLWRADIHIVPPFDIPHGWAIDRSFDYGSSHPFAVIWWAESDGNPFPMRDGTIRYMPKGTLVAIAEDYGWNGRPNEGVRLPATEIARRIRDDERRMPWGGRIRPGPADPSIYSYMDARSVADDMARSGVSWTAAASRDRVSGWLQLRNMLQAALIEPMQEPGLFVFETCRQIIRTLPVLPRDERNMDDCDTDAEDHLADAIRYRVVTKRSEVQMQKVIGA